MKPESSTTEVVPTITNTKESTPKAKESPDVPSVPKADTSIQIPTRYKTVESSSPEIKSDSRASVGPQEGFSDGETIVPTPGEMVALGRPPYIVDILNCRQAYETFDVKEQIGEIDEYIRADIPDDNTAYEKSVMGLLNQIKPTDDIYQKIEMIRDYVRIQSKIRNVIREKEEFEKKDPNDMNSFELKRYLNG